MALTEERKKNLHSMFCGVQSRQCVRSVHGAQPTLPASAVPSSTALFLRWDKWGCWGQNRTSREVIILDKTKATPLKCSI